MPVWLYLRGDASADVSSTSSASAAKARGLQREAGDMLHMPKRDNPRGTGTPAEKTNTAHKAGSATGTPEAREGLGKPGERSETGSSIALCSLGAMAPLWGEVCLRPVSGVCRRWHVADSRSSSLWPQSRCSPLLLSACALARSLAAGLQTRSSRDAQSVSHPAARRRLSRRWVVKPEPSLPYPLSAAQTC